MFRGGNCVNSLLVVLGICCSPHSSLRQEGPGDGVLPGAELAAVREIHRAELAERELLQVARHLDVLLLGVYVPGHLDNKIIKSLKENC